MEGSRDPQPFLDSYPEVCYYLSGGSVLGDEGVTGRDRLFLSKNDGWMDGWMEGNMRTARHPSVQQYV